MQYAVMDDSVVWKNGIAVYAHAIVFPDDVPAILLIQTSDRNIRQYFRQIFEFAREYTLSHKLFACAHYLTHYPQMVQELGIDIVDKGAPRQVKKLYNRADVTARTAAKNELESITQSMHAQITR